MEPRKWADILGPQSTVAAIPNGNGFAYRQRFEWIAYPAEQPTITAVKRDDDGEEIGSEEIPAPWWSEEYVGFRARVLVNPNGGEVRHEQLLHEKQLRRQISEADYLESLAYRVIEWDVVVIDRDGNRYEIPAPAQDSWERFLDLPPMLMSWLVIEIRHAHLPKAMTRAGKPRGSTGLPSPTPITQETEPPPS